MTTSKSYPGQRLLAAATIVAPIVFLVSDVAYITAGEHINRGVLGGTIGIWSCFLLGWAFLGISRALESVAPRGAVAMLVLAVPMVAGGTAFNVNGIHWGHFGNDFFEDAIALGDAPVGALAFLPWGWFAPLSFVVAGIFIWRTVVAPRWSGALMVLTGVLFISARPATIDALAISCDIVMVAAMVPIGLALWQRAADARATATVRTGDSLQM